MFDFIRTHQRLMQLLLLVLILPSFALIGMSGYTTYVSGDHDLVKIGKQAITVQDFDKARRDQLQQMQQQNRGGFDPASLDNNGARSELLESLIDQRVLVATATQDRFSVSDSVLRQAIAAMPELQVDGQFSTERYNAVLKSMGATSKDFEQSQRAQLALNRVLSPVGSTATVPGQVVDSLEQALTAQRTVRLLTFPVSDYQKNISITDADIKAWYDANKPQLELPQQVTAQYLLLDEAAAMKGLPAITPDELKKYYEQNKARYVQPARISLSHILVTVPVGATEAQRDKALSKAEEIAKQVKADKSKFADIAKAKSEDAGTAAEGGKLGWITQGSWPPKLEKSVFALAKGQVSDVVDGPGGYHIFLADDVQPAKGESIEEAKPKIESEIRRQLGADRFADMSTKLTGLVYDNQGSLQPAADALGLKVKEAGGIARERLLSASEAGPGAASAGPDAAVLGDIRVRQALFSAQVLTSKQNSGVIEISPDTMVVIRMKSITPAHVQPMDNVTALIRQKLTAERALAAADKAGKDALASYEKADAAKVPEGFDKPVAISRANTQGLNKQVLDSAFSASAAKLPAYVGISASQGYIIVRVEQAQPGKVDDPALAGLPTQLDQMWGQAEQQAVLKALRDVVKVKVLPDAQKALAGDAQTEG
jgi:peptidyl-prolyl cis-trans isomerase D